MRSAEVVGKTEEERNVKSSRSRGNHAGSNRYCYEVKVMECKQALPPKGPYNSRGLAALTPGMKCRVCFVPRPEPVHIPRPCQTDARLIGVG
jgi:hypothetical protein